MSSPALILLSRSALCLTAALIGCNFAAAQSIDDGWQDLETLSPDSAPNPQTQRGQSQVDDAPDRWRDLEAYESLPARPPRQSRGSSPRRSAPESSAPTGDGWYDIDTPPPFVSGAETNPVASQPAPSDGWRDIESDLSEVSADIMPPTSGLGAGDLVEIDVANAETLSGTYRISTLGTLVLPLIGSVDVAGLSADTLARVLEARYGEEYLVNPKVTITTREKIIGHVKIDGLVGRTQSLPLTSVLSLAEIISLSGGVTRPRSQLDAIILRASGTSIRARRVPLTNIALAEDAGLTIFPEDQITILKRESLPEMKDNSGRYPLLDTVLSGGSLRNFGARNY